MLGQLVGYLFGGPVKHCSEVLLPSYAHKGSQRRKDYATHTFLPPLTMSYLLYSCLLRNGISLWF